MNNLTQTLSITLIQELKKLLIKNEFPKLTFYNAMEFILTDGLMPASNLPVASLIKLDNWLQAHSANAEVRYTATELKNKTGEILEKVLSGANVRLYKHGRAIAEIKRL